MTTPKRPEGYREPTDEEIRCLPEGTLYWNNNGKDWVLSCYVGESVKFNPSKNYATPITEPSVAPTLGTDPKGEAGATKCPLWLLPSKAIEEVAFVLALGAKKYGPWNWRQNKVKASIYISAIMRHLNSWRDGEDNDVESGKSHLAHIAANCLILMDAALFGKLVDDRAKSLT